MYGIYLFVINMFSFNLDALVPVTTVQLGEPTTFTCVLPIDLSRRQLNWYKQSAGDNLKIIVALRKHTNPAYGPDFSASRFEVKENTYASNLTILRTIHEDEGMYHCALMDWIEITWSATYLSLKGKKKSFSIHFGICFGVNISVYFFLKNNST